MSIDVHVWFSITTSERFCLCDCHDRASILLLEINNAKLFYIWCRRMHSIPGWGANILNPICGRLNQRNAISLYEKKNSVFFVSFIFSFLSLARWKSDHILFAINLIFTQGAGITWVSHYKHEPRKITDRLSEALILISNASFNSNVR